MSFTVTPSSGAAPYTFDNVIDNRNMLDDVNYSATATLMQSSGSCNAPDVNGTVYSGLVPRLYTGNSYTAGTSVPSGRCQVVGIFIIRLSDGVVVSEAYASISNL